MTLDFLIALPFFSPLLKENLISLLGLEKLNDSPLKLDNILQVLKKNDLMQNRISPFILARVNILSSFVKLDSPLIKSIIQIKIMIQMLSPLRII